MKRYYYYHFHSILDKGCLVVSNSLQPMDYRPPGSSVHGILQARILEWVAISFSRGSSNPGIEPESYVSCIGKQILYH